MTRSKRTGPNGLVFRILALGLLSVGSGCGETRIDTTYGRIAGRSVNGTGVFASLLRDQGHEVRAARRLNEELGAWAETIVRFLPEPGIVGQEEADWYFDWQMGGYGRRLILVCRDGSAEAEYWQSALKGLPEDAPEHQRDRIEEKLTRAPDWESEGPPPGFQTADPDYWFRFDEQIGGAGPNGNLGGPWGEGIDPKAAALPLNRALEVSSPAETALLTGDDDRVIVMDWSWDDPIEDGDPSAVLVVANGSFLLNAAIVPHARRPLTMKVADWVGSSPRNVAFVEGSFLLGADSSMPTPWRVIRQVPELGMVAVHFMMLALIAALAHAVILGRPRAAPASGADRPRMHAEALGNLLSRIGSERAARSLLTTYRRWRRPQAHDDHGHQDGP
ncbi:DUF4350 domain-containing protein [Tautonia rosea]|uniref:DUF4350 domain-containing protein n=1 Tax=Tautonia rosea TaxID=2728037 RepID=UPI00147309E1|nr:DUF4350 domain-containing protein [Tautonia rosea]